jgi:hypothetical protein
MKSSACLSEVALRASPAHQEKFTGVMVRCMTFVMSKLGAKGVFHNTLLFSGRFLVKTRNMWGRTQTDHLRPLRSSACRTSASSF